MFVLLWSFYFLQIFFTFSCFFWYKNNESARHLTFNNHEVTYNKNQGGVMDSVIIRVQKNSKLAHPKNNYGEFLTVNDLLEELQYTLQDLKLFSHTVFVSSPHLEGGFIDIFGISGHVYVKNNVDYYDAFNELVKSISILENPFDGELHVIHVPGKSTEILIGGYLIDGMPTVN